MSTSLSVTELVPAALWDALVGKASKQSRFTGGVAGGGGSDGVGVRMRNRLCIAPQLLHKRSEPDGNEVEVIAPD